MKRAFAGLCAVWAVIGCSSKSDGPVESTNSPVTYYSDVAPIFQDHCMSCHQEGGIGAFRLDDYAVAKQYAALIAARTQARTMPPWGAVSDGSCGTFTDSLALSDPQIALISKWASSGAKEGTAHELSVPALPSLERATPYQTPEFSPVAQGGPLTESDEYRCFLLDSGVDAQRFITGYDVKPGNDAIVHHVLAFVVDPSAPAELQDEPQLTNGALMDRLHAESPDRDGWQCFGMAGDGVGVKSAPVVWAPGQGAVKYPVQSGVPLAPTDKIVLQVHYNLRDPKAAGARDQTTVQLQLADQVERIGIFILSDPFLSTLGDAQPALLKPGKPSEKYVWTRKLSDFGLSQLPGLQLNGVMPHMHQLGRKYELAVNTGSQEECAANVQNWDFHWQRMYFYDQPPALDPKTTFRVTCDYDTSSVSSPVMPGWGTSNEMCLATLYFTAPAAAFQH